MASFHVAVLFLALAFYLCADGDPVAIDRDVDIVLVRARHFSLDAIDTVVIGNVDANIRRLQFESPRTQAEAAEDVVKRNALLEP